MKQPAFQFYPGDWLREAGLRSCSASAKGLWIELICIAHDCDDYGVLQVGGAPLTTEELARMTGIEIAECVRLLAELERKGVFSRKENGAIYSRRMVKDAALSATRSKSAGKRYSKTDANLSAKDLQNTEVEDEEEDEIEVVNEIEFEKLWNEYPKPLGKKSAFKAFMSSVRTPDDLAAIRRALDAYKAHCAVIEEKFIQHGKTWFNNWRDWLISRPRAVAEAERPSEVLEPRTRLADSIREWANNGGNVKSDEAMMAKFGFTRDEFNGATDEQITQFLSAGVRA